MTTALFMLPISIIHDLFETSKVYYYCLKTITTQLNIMKLAIQSPPKSAVFSCNSSLSPPPAPGRKHQLKNQEDVPAFLFKSQSIMSSEGLHNIKKDVAISQDQPLPLPALCNQQAELNKFSKKQYRGIRTGSFASTFTKDATNKKFLPLPFPTKRTQVEI
jgi:hypothetical protein